MRKRKAKILIIITLFVFIGIMFFAAPISYPKYINDKKAPMAVILSNTNIETMRQEGDNTWTLHTTSKVYEMKENEATNIKERVSDTLQDMKCYRTPYTIAYNYMKETRRNEAAEDEQLTFIFHSEDETNVLSVKGNYIILDGKYYSLGWKGKKKGLEFVEKIHIIMEDAEEYLRETEE